MKQERHWHTITELADSIEMTRASVWHWVRDGKLRSVRHGSRHRITQADWQECLDNFNRKQKTGTP